MSFDITGFSGSGYNISASGVDPPNITVQPVDETVTLGSLAEFSFEADNVETNQWEVRVATDLPAPVLVAWQSNDTASVDLNVSDPSVLDWAVWGDSSITPFQRKATGGSLIDVSAEGLVSTLEPFNYNLSWTDGTSPTSGSTTDLTTVANVGATQGQVIITVPVGRARRSIKVHFGGAGSESPNFTLQYSVVVTDGSNPTVIGELVVPNAVPQYRILHIECAAASENQLVGIIFSLPPTTGSAQIHLKAITVEVSASGAFPVGFSQLTPPNSQDSGPLAVTIPAAANAYVVSGIYYANDGNVIDEFIGSSITTQGLFSNNTGTDPMGCYLAYGKVSATGAQTVQLNKASSSYGEGPTCQIIWLNVPDPDDFFRDHALLNGDGTLTGIVDTSATDYVLGYIMYDTNGFGTVENHFAGSRPLLGRQTHNLDNSIVRDVKVQGATTSLSNSPLTWQALSLISIKGPILPSIGPWTDVPLLGSIDFPRLSSNDRVTRNESFPYNAAYTALMWIKRTLDPNDFQHIFAIASELTYSAGPQVDFLSTTDDGTTFRAGCAGGASNSFVNLFYPLLDTEGYWVALVRESATILKVYIGIDETDFAQIGANITDDVSARPAANYVIIGGYNNLHWGGQVAHPRLWTRALSLAELQAEIQSPDPVSTTGLWSAPPFRGDNLGIALIDESGNDRHFSTSASNVDLSNVTVPLFGGTSSRYVFRADETIQPGTQYRSALTNAGGTVYTDVVDLTVTIPPIEITLNPSNATVTAGDPAVFSGLATGPLPISYQWQVNTGATTPTPLVYRDSVFGGDTTLTVSSINIPAPTTVENDVEFVFLTVTAATPADAPTLSTPSGWTLEYEGTSFVVAGGSFAARMYLFTRRVTSTPPGSVLFDAGELAIFIYVRASYSNPSAGAFLRQLKFTLEPPGNTTIITPAFDSNVALNSTVIAVLIQDIDQVATAPGSMTTRVNSATYGITLADENTSAAGAFGTRTFNISNSAASAYVLVVELVGVPTPVGYVDVTDGTGDETTEYTTINTLESMNGNLYRFRAADGVNTVFSTGALLTVNPSGGGAFNASQTETLALTTTSTATSSQTALSPEVVALLDSQVSLSAALAEQEETVAPVDSSSGVVTQFVAQEETETPSESSTASAAFTGVSEDTVAPVESQASALESEGAQSETLSSDDSTTESLASQGLISESVGVTETSEATNAATSTQEETNAATDSSSSELVGEAAQVETGTATDTSVPLLSAQATSEDTVVPEDSVSATATFTESVEDTTAPSDTVTSSATQEASRVETVTLVEDSSAALVAEASQLDAVTPDESTVSSLSADTEQSESLISLEDQTAQLDATVEQAESQTVVDDVQTDSARVSSQEEAVPVVESTVVSVNSDQAVTEDISPEDTSTTTSALVTSQPESLFLDEQVDLIALLQSESEDDVVPTDVQSVTLGVSPVVTETVLVTEGSTKSLVATRVNVENISLADLYVGNLQVVLLKIEDVTPQDTQQAAVITIVVSGRRIIIM